MERKNVVIIKDTKGNTCFVAYPKMLDKNEINKSINESMAYQQAKEEEIKDLKKHCLLLERNLCEIGLDVALDRGEITKEQFESLIEDNKNEYLEKLAKIEKE